MQILLYILTFTAFTSLKHTYIYYTNVCVCVLYVEIRVLGGQEMPLKLQLGHSQKKPYIELRLLQVRDVLAPPMMSSTSIRGGVVGGMMRTDSEESLEGDGNNIVPKEEGQ